MIPYYPKEPLLYPHLRSFMRFPDTTQFQIPQPTKYANSDSSPFNSDESLSDEDSQTFMTPSTTDDSSQTFMTPFNTSNQNFFQEDTPSVTSNHKSLIPLINDYDTIYYRRFFSNIYDTIYYINQNFFQEDTPSVTSNHKSLIPSINDIFLYRNIINTPHTNIPSDRSRHSSHNQTNSLPPLIDRTMKTTYKLRHQPKLDYRLFITFETLAIIILSIDPLKTSHYS